MTLLSSRHWHFRLRSHLLPRGGHDSASNRFLASATPPVSKPPIPAAAACSNRLHPLLVAVSLRRESNVLLSMQVLLLASVAIGSHPLRSSRARAVANRALLLVHRARK
jgi:hypothetical protein